MDGAPGLPVSSADGVCPLSVGTDALATTSRVVVESSGKGSHHRKGTYARRRDSKLESLNGTINSFLPVATPSSRSSCNCVRNGLVNAVPDA